MTFDPQRTASLANAMPSLQLADERSMNGFDLRRRNLLKAALASMACLSVPAAASSNGPIPFRRGVNLSMWFELSGEEIPTDGDLGMLARSGFDHVRLPVDPLTLGWQARTGQGAAFDRLDILDRAINSILGAGLNLILDFHPVAESLDFLKSPRGQRAWLDAWDAWARRYARIDTNRLAFELMNEPGRVYGSDRAAWAQAQRQAIHRIRDHATGNWIFTAGFWDPLDSLRTLEPPRDSRLIASTHFYWPYELTHMGANWDDAVSSGRSDLRNLRYPASLTDPRTPLVRPGSSNERAAKLASDYRAAEWDIEKLRPHIEDAAQWSKEYSIPVHYTEFGILRLYADADSRYRWLHDVRSLIESRGMGWTVWDLSCTFGIIDFSGEDAAHPHPMCPAHSGPMQIEKGVLKALNLADQ